MWKAIEDTITCKSTVRSSRVISILITVVGFGILATGIADVVSVATMCPVPLANVVKDYSWVAVGIWGPLPIIVTGILANFLIDNTAYTVKFLQLSTLASSFLFAPAIIVISAVDSGTSSSSCGTVNSFAISVTLAVMGGVAWVLLTILSCRMYYPRSSGDDKIVVAATRSHRVYAQKDEFMVSDVPSGPQWNNGAAAAAGNSVVVDASKLPVHNLVVPVSLGGQPKPATATYGYLQQQGAQSSSSGGLATAQQLAYNVSSKDQLAFSQYQKAPVQAGGAVIGGMVGGVQGQTGAPGYFVNFLPGDKVVTNAYPQLYRIS